MLKTRSGSAALSVNGLRPQANNYILDGIDNNDGLVNTILFFPSVDATQEFKVNTSVAPAEYGRAGGAIVVTSLNQGTNQFHGAVFEFYRDKNFDSNPNYRFNGAPASEPGGFIRNQPGFAVGGPYAGSTTLGAQAGWIFDPTTCDPKGVNLPAQFSYNGAPNVIPTARLNPAAVNYLNAYPTPTRTDRYLDNYLDNQSEANKYNTFDGRIDWIPSSKDLLFFRYSYDNSVNTKTSEFTNLPAGGGTGINPTHARGYDLGYTHQFSPTIVNEAHIGYNRDNYGYTPPMYGSYVSKDLGIVNANINMETTGGVARNGIDTGLDTPYPHPERLIPFIGNHDTARFFTEAKDSVPRLKLALGLVLTLRGTPQIYSGDEIGMPGGKDPDNRRDFPGGFAGDPRSAFTSADRTTAEEDLFSWTSGLLRLRSAHTALQTGLEQNLFADQDVFAFTRSPDATGCAADHSREQFLIVVNKAAKSKVIELPLEETALAGCVQFRAMQPTAAPSPTADGGKLRVEQPAESMTVYVVR
jgi:hypothetical protein